MEVNAARLSKEEASALAARMQANVPLALRERKQWLIWRLEPGEKKAKKMPYYVGGGRRTGEQGSETDRDKLVTFEVVLAALQSLRCSGVGFAFLPGDGLIGIDIDGQLGEDGTPSERAAAIIASCVSYTELSPSRRGVHIIVGGESETFKSNDIGLEVFCGRQFFTVTGDPVAGTPPQVSTIEPRVLSRLKATVKQAKGQPKNLPTARTDTAQNDFATVNAAAMARLDAWVPEVFPGARRYHQGYRVSNKELGRDLEEDISIVPKGIVDYGVNDLGDPREGKRTPIDLVMEWTAHSTAVAAMKWLASRLGLPLGGKVAKGSVRNDSLPPGKTNSEGQASAQKPEALLSRADERLRRNDQGGVRNTPANVDLIMRHDPQWSGVLAYDEFSYRIMKLRTPPFDGGRAGPWEETDATKAAIWLEREWGLPAKSKVVDEIARSIAWDERFHSVRKMLEALPRWDGVSRLPTLMQDAFGVKQNAYTEHIGCGLLVTAVARIYKPGCKVDTMIVLEGLQGSFKSTALIELFSPELYVDIIDPPAAKDFYITLQGSWCVEIGEMQSFSRADVNHVKQAITRRNDKFRAPYDKAASDHPRQSIFVGTTNADTYLMDPTGGRRFLPVRCSGANLDYIRAVREQLFAEALVLFKAGFRWWEFPAEDAQAEQDKRFVEDSWIEPIETWLSGLAEPRMSRYPEHLAMSYPNEQPAAVLCPTSPTTTQIMQHALQIELAKHTKADQMRVSQIMRRLEWAQSAQQRMPGSSHTRIRPWTRPLSAGAGTTPPSEPRPPPPAVTRQSGTSDGVPF